MTNQTETTTPKAPTEAGGQVERVVGCTAADTLKAHVVFKGAHGLEGLLNADEFWESQPYGSRFYYGIGGADYLHRDVLRTAVEALKLTPNGPDVRHRPEK